MKVKISYLDFKDAIKMEFPKHCVVKTEKKGHDMILTIDVAKCKDDDLIRLLGGTKAPSHVLTGKAFKQKMKDKKDGVELQASWFCIA